MADDWTHQQTEKRGVCRPTQLYRVEKWTKDGSKVDRLLYAGNDLDMARELFREAVSQRPRIRLTIRQRSRVLERWPAIDLAK